MSADLLRRAAGEARSLAVTASSHQWEARHKAVADWLEDLAEMVLDWEPYKGCDWCGDDHALAVARAYLGETS